MTRPMTAYMPADILDPTSPLLQPQICPTHIEVDGYGRLPVRIQKRSFWSDTWTPVTPDVHSRVLYTQPVHPQDMVHTRTPPSQLAVFGCTLAASVGGAVVVTGILSQAPMFGALVAVAGALLWLLAVGTLLEVIAPARIIGAPPQVAAEMRTFGDLPTRQMAT